MDGGSGNDRFVFRTGFGDDVITGYNATGTADQMQFVGFGSARPTTTQVGSDVQIHFASGDDILLVGVKLSALTSQDFLYR
jgi:Ca2+-binding RTX toxin-like protein